MNFKSDSYLDAAGAWHEGGGISKQQPTRACKTRFTIKAKVVDNTMVTRQRGSRAAGAAEGREGRRVTSGVEPRAADTERRSFSFIKGNGLAGLAWPGQAGWRLLAHVEAGLGG